MRFRHLDINLLVVLEAILTHKNITRAAEQLCLSQSAASGMLARLRTHFEDDLVVRTGRRMILTPLAEELLAPLRSILSETEQLLAMRSAFDPATSERQFTIACSDYIWVTLILEIVTDLRKIAPFISIYYQGPSTRFFKTEIDLLVIPDNFLLEDCPSTTLPPKPFVCIVWDGNNEVGEDISLDLFIETRHAQAYSERSTFIESWFFEQFGRAPKVGITVPSFTLIPEALVGTKFLALVPQDLADRAVATLPIRKVEIAVPLPLMTDVLQWRESHDSDPGLQWMISEILGVASRK